MEYKTILGIDPGTSVMGYGIIRTRGKLIELDNFGVIDLHKYVDHHVKLQKIFERCLYLIEEYKPNEMAIETPFYGKNVQSMLKLGRAQGVAIAAALYRSVPVFEYAPRKMKLAITGNGNASKEQVAAMLKNMLQIKEQFMYLDATDALGVAVCHHYQCLSPLSAAGSNVKDWGDFIKKNPDRIVNN